MPIEFVRCANCGTEHQSAEGYCPGCGTALGTRLCANGHVMAAEWVECRYCQSKPANQGAESRAEKQPQASGAAPEGSAHFGSRAGLLEATPKGASGAGNSENHRPPPAVPADGGSIAPRRSAALKHRTVYDPGLAPETSGPPRASPARASPPRVGGARLVGWLVSFSLDPSGIDFPLREGRNLLGADPDCDVVIEGDPAISGTHAVVMYRRGELQIRDSDSTNGTHVNGQDIFGESGVRIESGDRIRVGQVELTVHLL